MNHWRTFLIDFFIVLYMYLDAFPNGTSGNINKEGKHRPFIASVIKHIQMNVDQHISKIDLRNIRCCQLGKSVPLPSFSDSPFSKACPITPSARKHFQIFSK